MGSILAICLLLTLPGKSSHIIRPPADSTIDASNYLEAENFVLLTPRQFEQITGEKLNIFQRLYFKKAQKKIQSALLSDRQPDVHHFYDTDTKKFKFDLLWFIIGAIIGPFALLFSYTSKQPKSKRRSALLGFGLFILWFGYLFVF